MTRESSSSSYPDREERERIFERRFEEHVATFLALLRAQRRGVTMRQYVAVIGAVPPAALIGALAERGVKIETRLIHYKSGKRESHRFVLAENGGK